VARRDAFRYGRISAGLLICFAAGALASVGLVVGGNAASAAYYYYCPGGGAGGIYGYCPPPTTTGTTGTTTTPEPQPPGFMTGGGQFDPAGACTKASFGGNASGQPLVAAKGHFNYLNHCTGVRVNGPVTEILAVNPLTQTMTFEVRVSATCDAIVTWRDSGEPGTSDSIALTFSGTGCPPDQTSGAVAIDRGNIQWHKNVR
jgi:hypothetical protein